MVNKMMYTEKELEKQKPKCRWGLSHAANIKKIEG